MLARSCYISLKSTSDTTFYASHYPYIKCFAAVQNMASEALSQPCQDPALNDAAFQEMLENIDSRELSKYIYNTARMSVFNL